MKDAFVVSFTGLTQKQLRQLTGKAGLFLGIMAMTGAVMMGQRTLVKASKSQTKSELRRVISLNGSWQIAQGGMDKIPGVFSQTVPVPGLVDMASPPFKEVGVKSDLRSAFWYRKVFRIDGQVPAIATLKLSKAMFGTKVYLNGTLIGEHIPLFTPGFFDLKSCLKGDDAENDLVIRVGANFDSIPSTYPRGEDAEKIKYIPGIFDDVELILTGTPNIVRVQVMPDISHGGIHVQALLHNSGSGVETPVTFIVREWRSGVEVVRLTVPDVSVAAGEDKTVDTEAVIPRSHLWSPEDPFLYALEVVTSTDDLRTRFGMREFHLNPTDGKAYLNGRIYYLRGSNITIYRFFEDADRGNLPWDKDWVRRLHRSFKPLHWNTVRYCIGFPPDFWYDIADEEGILLQDEFPVWGHVSDVTSDELAREYTEHMQNSWNHPSIVLWDAQNETTDAPQTGKAIEKVRNLDLSRRPWDNGWGGVGVATDSFESHPYHFLGQPGSLHILSTPPQPLSYYAHAPREGSELHPAIIINEYAGIWLQRDGYPTKVMRPFYDAILGPKATPDQYRKVYSHYMAAETEYWRGHRDCAGVLQFTALGYSRPDGVTSDNFVDVKNLTYEPHLYSALKNAFSPVGLMLDFWEEDTVAGQTRSVPAVIVNDLYTRWQGSVKLRLTRGGKTVSEQTWPLTVDPLGREEVKFDVVAPLQAGLYQLQALLVRDGEEPVISDRDFPVREDDAAKNIAKSRGPSAQ